MVSKITDIQKAVEPIGDYSTVAIGGNTVNRAPMALVREVARQGKRNLALVKTAGAMDVDLLCFAGCVRSVDAGFISYETKYSLANHYRKAVQAGVVKANEHACYTVISALRAARAGVPFMPVRGLVASDLIEANDYFKVIDDPFTGMPITVVRAIEPDYALLHVHEADEEGNALISAPAYDDILIAKASKHIIITAERIVPERMLRREGEHVRIPGFLVDAVVPLENGAAPCACQPDYSVSDRGIMDFKALKEPFELEAWLESYESADRRRRGGY